MARARWAASEADHLRCVLIPDRRRRDVHEGEASAAATLPRAGVPKAEITRCVGVGRRTVYHWIETGQLDRELDAEPARYEPRRQAPSKLDPYKAIIDERLATYSKLSAT